MVACYKLPAMSGLLRTQSPRPELVVDQRNGKLVDPNGNFVGWDGHVIPGGWGTANNNVSTLSRGKMIYADPNEETRRL